MAGRKRVGNRAYEQSLGLRWIEGCYRHREQEPIATLFREVDPIIKQYAKLGKDGIRTSTDLKLKLSSIFDHLGPLLWPDVLKDRSSWLVDAYEDNRDGRYPRNLYYCVPEDRQKLKDHFCSWIELKCLRHNEQHHHSRSREPPPPSRKRDVSAHPRGDSSSDCSDSSLTDIETEDEDAVVDPDYVEGSQVSNNRRTPAIRKMHCSDASSALLAQRAIQDLVDRQEVTREATTTPWHGMKRAMPVTDSISANGKRQASQDASAPKRLCTNASALAHGEREPSRTATPPRGDRGLSAVSARLAAIPKEVSTSDREKRELLAALRSEYEATSAHATNLQAMSHPAPMPSTSLQSATSTDSDVHEKRTDILCREADPPAHDPFPRITYGQQDQRSISHASEPSGPMVHNLLAVSAADLDSAPNPNSVDAEHNRSTKEQNATIPSMSAIINKHVYEALPPIASNSNTTCPDVSHAAATSTATSDRPALDSSALQMDLAPNRESADVFANADIIIDWSLDTEPIDYLTMERCEYVEDFFLLIEGYMPFELREKQKRIAEVVIRTLTKVDGPKIDCRIIRDNNKGRHGLMRMQKLLVQQCQAAEVELKLAIVWS